MLDNGVDHTCDVPDVHFHVGEFDAFASIVTPNEYDIMCMFYYQRSMTPSLTALLHSVYFQGWQSNTAIEFMHHRWRPYSELLPILDRDNQTLLFDYTEWREVQNRHVASNAIGEWYYRFIEGVITLFQLTDIEYNRHDMYYFTYDRQIRRLRIPNRITTFNELSYLQRSRAEIDTCVDYVRNQYSLRNPYERTRKIRHYYSSTRFDVYEQPILIDPNVSMYLNGNMERDSAAVRFVTRFFIGDVCHHTKLSLDVCRCRFCALLHTALIPEHRPLSIEHDEEFRYYATRCVEIDIGHVPVERQLVNTHDQPRDYPRQFSLSEHMSEFVVQP